MSTAKARRLSHFLLACFGYIRVIRVCRRSAGFLDRVAGLRELYLDALDLESIEAAVGAGRSAIDAGNLLAVEIIPRPHEDLHQKLMW